MCDLRVMYSYACTGRSALPQAAVPHLRFAATQCYGRLSERTLTAGQASRARAAAPAAAAGGAAALMQSLCGEESVASTGRLMPPQQQRQRQRQRLASWALPSSPEMETTCHGALDLAACINGWCLDQLVSGIRWLSSSVIHSACCPGSLLLDCRLPAVCLTAASWPEVAAQPGCTDAPCKRRPAVRFHVPDG